MDDGQEFPVRVEIMHQLQHAVHVPGQHTEIEIWRFRPTSFIQSKRRFCLAGSRTQAVSAICGDRPVAPGAADPVTGAVFSQQRLHLPELP